MSVWEVQRDKRDNRIIAIRPVGFRGWGRLDGKPPLEIKQEDLGLEYHRLDEVSVSKNGNGIDKSEQELIKEQAIKGLVEEDPAAVAAQLTVADLEAEIAKRNQVIVLPDKGP